MMNRIVWRLHSAALSLLLSTILFAILSAFQADGSGSDQTQARKYFKTYVSPALKANDGPQIEATLRKCLKISPRYYRALCAFGLYKLGKGDWSQALDYLTRAQEAAPNKKVAAALQALANGAKRCQSQDPPIWTDADGNTRGTSLWREYFCRRVGMINRLQRRSRRSHSTLVYGRGMSPRPLPFGVSNGSRT